MAATTPRARKKATTPRKAAGRTAPAKAAAKPAEPVDEDIFDDDDDATPPTNRDPELFQPLPGKNKPGTPTHPYGDVAVYVYTPTDGSTPIVFPKISTLPVTAKFMWRIYALNEMFQSFEWMNLANVPRDVQERVVDLPHADRQAFWSGWFKDVTSPMSPDQVLAPPGES